MPEDRSAIRVPPHSEEAEQSVLGSALLDREAVQIACENLAVEDFYNPRNREIFGGISRLYRSGQAVDLVTLKSEMERQGTLENAGGVKYLSQLAAAVPTSVYVENYVRIVKNRAAYRRFIALGQDILQKSYGTEVEVGELTEQVEKAVFDIIQKRGESDFKHVSEVVQSAYDELQALSQNGGALPGIPTGFIDLDRRLAGLHNSDLIIIGARPAMGKSALGLNIVQHAALREGKTCAVFSLEMSAVQVVNRMIAVDSGVTLEKLRTGNLEEKDWEPVAMAIGRLAKSEIYIDDTAGVTISEIRSKCRKLKIEKGLDLVMIDYMQLMSSGPRGSENRQQEISEISRGLKVMARDLQIPVIALSQLGRRSETRADNRPMMSDLRESGSIEQDADVVMFIYRDEYYHPDTEAVGEAEIIVAKQRNGSVGTEKLRYDGVFTRFGNLEKKERFGSYRG